ncbi:MAG: hypothetical protein IPI42_16345 [Saprospiraceae bacterium]|nr:hypothetical protein [Candidatus Parvibacillus calidus]
MKEDFNIFDFELSPVDIVHYQWHQPQRKRTYEKMTRIIFRGENRRS